MVLVLLYHHGKKVIEWLADFSLVAEGAEEVELQVLIENTSSVNDCSKVESAPLCLLCKGEFVVAGHGQVCLRARISKLHFFV